MVFELNALSEFLFDDGFSTLALVDVEEEEEEEEHSPISVIYFFVLVFSLVDVFTNARGTKSDKSRPRSEGVKA